jgi:hypothetical protein
LKSGKGVVVGVIWRIIKSIIIGTRKIHLRGDSGSGGISPSGSGYTKIYSSNSAFAALNADGSIKVWGNPDSGGASAPSGNDYTKIYSTRSAFAALKADGVE